MTSTGALSGFFPEAEVIERKRAPKRLASYVLGARLGRGAFAKVKEAYHIDRPHIRLAIKIIDVARLRRKMMGMATHHAEIAILKTLNHPRIVQYVDSFEDTRKGKVYIALEYMPGGDLQHLIDKRDLSLAETRGVFRSLIEGLAYIHGLGIVHQDIKPSNLLINGIGAVKISDFGVAQYVEAEDLAVRTSADIPSVEGPDDGNDDDESSSYSSSESPRMVPPCHLPHPIPETILLTPSTTTTTTTTTKTSKSPSTSATTTTTTTTTDGIIIAEQEPARSSSSSSSSESTTSSKKISSQLASSGGEAATSKEAASLKLASPSTGPTKTDANGRLVSSSATIQTGAPAFQPPELAGSSGVPSVHPATDIWAAGITLFRLIQGCLPFQLQEANVYQLWKVIAKGDFQIPDDLEDELRSLLTRLLEPDPKKRISAAEVLQHPWLANHADDEPLQDITFGPTLFTSETTPEKSDRTREEESGRLTGDSTLDSYDDSEDMTGADPHSRSSHDYTEPKSSPAHRRKTTHLCGFCNIQ